MKWHVLNMAEASCVTDEFAKLDDRFEVVHLPPEQRLLEKHIGEADVYFCSLKVQVNRTVIDAAERLKLIVTPSTGLDHIDVDYAREHGIDILSLRDETELLARITSTGELAWALLLGVVRRIPWSFDAVKQGIWGREQFRGNQLSGKTLGILGYGRLGRIVAEYGQAFRMNVMACDIKHFIDPRVERADMETLLRSSDVLSIHVHLTSETTGLIGRKEFDIMKRGIILINTSRGAVIDEQELIRALESGIVAGAGIDVIDGEWLTSQQIYRHPVVHYAREHRNVLITPHIGGVTFESQALAYNRSIEKMVDYAQKFTG